MSLVPAPVNELESILPSPSRSLAPTGDQYVAYFGRTPRERYDSIFEGASVAFMGSMFAYFVSFVIGQFLATCLGIVFLFWPILSPEFKAYQRNWELIGGRDLVDVWMDDDDFSYGGGGGGDGMLLLPEDKRGLYGAYYVASIEDACVVDDVRATSDDEYDLSEFVDYTMSSDELESVTGIPWKLRLRLSDGSGRGMQVHSRMSEHYLGIRPGMTAVGVLLSAGREFRKLAGMTDFCVLDVEGDGSGVEAVAWVGDYPYLDKAMFLRTLDENGITDRLLDDYERRNDYDEEEEDDDDGNIGDDEDIEEADDSDDEEEEDDDETEEYVNV